MVARSPSRITEEVFAGGGEMGARMRALDWSKTPLGPVETWPQSLKTSVSICLNSRFAILLWWGPELVKIYNDAYVEFIGSKHPWALGSPGRKVWPEIWDAIGPMLEGVMERGEANRAEDLLLLLERHGYAEECYFTFSYSPIRNESGGVGGVFTPVLETTSKIIAERRLRTLRSLAAIGGNRSRNAHQACSAALQVLATNRHDIPFAAIYLFEPSPDPQRIVARLVGVTAADERPMQLAEILDSGDGGWIPCEALLRGETCVLALNAYELDLPRTPWGVPPSDAIALPFLHSEQPNPVGFLLAGISPRKQLDENYRDFYAQAADQIASAVRESEMLGRESTLRAEAEADRTQIHELFMNAPAAIIATSGPDHRVVLSNQRYAELIGRSSPAELLGKTVLELLPETEEQGFIGLLNSVYRTGVPYIGREATARIKRGPDGMEEDLYFDFVYQPHRNAEGKTDGIIVHVTDTTAQVLARRVIEEREAQFRVLADSIPQLAWMAQPDGSIDWYNQRWYDYTGTTFEQMAGWGWQSVHDPEILPAVVSRYQHSMETGTPFNMEFPLRGADGTFRPFLSLALPVRDADGKIFRWFGTNTNMETQQKAEAALRQSEKLAAVGRLASSIAHEINNPLEGVTNLVYLARGSAVHEETKLFLEQAEAELKRVSQITNQTLRFHKQQSSPAATDCIELLDSIVTLYRGKLSRDNIELVLETQDCPPLTCYAGEIRQVIANLLGNALDAMPKGGTLRLRVRPSTYWRTGRSGIRFTVADTGHGMSPETMRRIYEPFFTTKGETGTGLGLWVSAGIVDNHGGSMHVRSSAQVGKSGTAFTVIFPHDGTGGSATAE
jgi:PAS domain S-box-containing protein